MRAPGRWARTGVALLLAGAIGLGCSSPREVRVTLLGTTDVHGYLLPYDYATDRPRRGSLAQAVTLVDSVRLADSLVLLLDSGDLLQGSALNSYRARSAAAGANRRPHPVVAAMNAVGYDAAVVGNHEFNYGLPYLRRTLGDARFPFLAANVRLAGTDSTLFPPYTVVRAGPIRVGVLGLTTPGAAIWDRGHLEGRLEFDDIVSAARRWIAELAQASDVIVAIVHSGLGPGSSYASDAGVPEENAVARLAREIPSIRVIFAGHAHERISGIRYGTTLVLAAGRWAETLAVAHLRLRQTRSGWELVGLDGRLLPTGDAVPAPRIVKAVERDHRETLAWLSEPIGTTPDHWSAAEGRFRDTPIADLITEVERRAAGADLASTAIFDPRASFGPGPITRRDLLALYVYPNTLRAVRLSGADLKAYLERSALYYRTWPADPLVNDSVPGFNFDIVSGVEYEIDLRRPPGDRVVALRRNGAPLKATDSLILALNSYRRSGGGGFQMVAEAPLVYSDEKEVAELLIEFVRARGTLRHADVFRENWRLLPEEAIERLKAERAGAIRH